jgi:hypothetical protein
MSWPSPGYVAATATMRCPDCPWTWQVGVHWDGGHAVCLVPKVDLDR